MCIRYCLPLLAITSSSIQKANQRPFAARPGRHLIAASFATTSIEDMAALAIQPLWFQLYINPDRGVTRELVERTDSSWM